MFDCQQILSAIPQELHSEFFQLIEFYGGNEDLLKSRLHEFFSGKLELSAFHSAVMTSGAIEVGKYLESQKLKSYS